ncbi:hypothetical protein [Mesorhizobium sp. 10J20-29]
METRPSEFIDLGRTLRDIPVGENLTDELDLQQRISSGASKTWTELCSEMRVVVLAEAGAGKTWEIRNLTQRLRHDGKVAFFVRLELLVDNFDLAFEPGIYPEFQAWLAGQDEAWFLLDSVDEARLRHPGDFVVAIKRIAAALGAASARAHIVLTGRISAWRPATDLALCHEQLPHPSPRINKRVEEEADESAESAIEIVSDRGRTGGATHGYRLVALDDLNDDQIGRFIAARGVTEPAAFMNAVERADAKGLVGRPQDLDELVDFWRDKQRIGSRWELLTDSIERRLAERDQNRADAQPLSSARALLGAQTLAAAVTTVGVPVIRVPDGDDGADGLAATAVLPRWTPAEIGVLLQRPIFDGAIYGTVRFHHRSVREFLAAQWFANRLAHAPSRLGIEQLFFRRQYGIEVLSSILRPVLPWLVLMDEGIRRRVLDLTPEVIFEGGDPSRLPLEDQKRILTDVCDQLARHTSLRTVQDFAAVQRFANKDIADEIKVLLQRYGDDEQVAPFLLRMVWLGQLRELAPEVIRLAGDPRNAGYRRITAMRALNAIGTAAEIDAVRQAVLTDPGDLDRRLLSEMISSLPGTPNDTSWLLDAIRRAVPKRKHEVDHLSHEIAAYVERSAVIDPALLVGFESLLATAPMLSGLNNDVSQRFEWVLKAASRSVERLIRERDPIVLTPAVHNIIRRISTARSYQSNVLSDEKEVLAELVPAWPELNRAQFWHDVDQFRARLVAKGNGRLVDWWRPANYGAAWKFVADDFGYVVEAVGQRPLLDDKHVALSLAFHLYQGNDRPRPWLAAMKRMAADGQLAERLHALLHPAPDPEMRTLKAQQRRWKRRDKERQAAEAKELKASRDNLTAHLPMLRAELSAHPEKAGQLNAIRYLFDRTRNDQHQNHWSSYDWRVLIADFGEELAELFRDAARNFWRLNRPVLRSEGAPANETAFATILGLAGLDIETRETPLILETLTPNEVEIASRHAVSELNGFPAWFPALYEYHHTAVATFLFTQIEWELSGMAAENRGSDVLSDVCWSGQWSWNEIGPMLLALLGKREPIDGGALGKALRIVRGANGPDAAMAELARSKCQIVTDIPRLGQWFAVWVGTEPEAAIPAASERLTSLEATVATELAMHMAVALLGGDHYDGPVARSAFLHPRPLRLLYELLHQYIRRTEDIHRAGSGVYSPGLRDHAQDARDSILIRLRDQPGKEALLALRDLVTGQPGREWLSGMVRGKAEQEGDIEPFKPHELVYLGEHFERRPGSARQLGDTARLRLHQLKEAAEARRSLDPSVRDIADPVAVRDLVQGRLVEQSDNAYAVTASNGPPPALLLTGIGHAATQPMIAVTSEEALDATWIDALDAANSSRRGVLGVVHMARSKRWRLPWSRQPTLEKAVAAAKAQWQAREGEVPTLDDVEVIGIDLTAIPLAAGKKGLADHFFETLRWFWRTTPQKVGAWMIAAAVAALTGIVPALLDAASEKYLDLQLNLQEAAPWVGWVLLVLGLAIFFIGIANERNDR